MSEYTFGDKDMTGGSLPEDSQRLLAQIRNHLHVLAQWAQSRSADDAQELAREGRMRELIARLGPLAEQLNLLLAGVSEPARRETADKAPTADHAPVGAAADNPAQDDRAAEAEGVVGPRVGDDAFLFGVTLDQIDQLDRLVERIMAYGDAVSANGAADFAPGTLSILGHTIFDRAIELEALVSAIYAQTLEEVQRASVKETPAAYRVQPAPWVELEADPAAALRPLPQAHYAAAPGLLLH